MLSTTLLYNEAFARDVIQGLQAPQKFISSRWFYDKIGDDLFNQITALPEYYLTKCEKEILTKQAFTIVQQLSEGAEAIQLIELGPGDGSKILLLLNYFLETGIPFRYCPVDISENVLELINKELSSKFPNLIVEPIAGDFTSNWEESTQENERRVVLFLGSSVGNFPNDMWPILCNRVATKLSTNDRLLIGFDLKKSPETILNAYNDPSGVTANFNYNLLERMNREFGADFDTSLWQHYPIYDPMAGEARSYLVAQKAQTVHFDLLEMAVHFEAYEAIFTEVSHKFDLHQILRAAEKSGCRVGNNFADSKQWFVDSHWIKN